MIDIITRALRHPIDYSSVCRVSTLKFKEKVSEGGGVYSFIFTADNLPSWKAGQHAIFTMPGKAVTEKTWRPFSVASTPHEGVIRIGTIISDTPSSFKKHLGDLKPDDSIRMYGPYGELYVRPEIKEIVAVAGGIGITPFRSIVADLAHKKSDVRLTLIYSAKESHVYRQELDTWSSQNNNVNIIYTHTSEEVNLELEKQIANRGSNTHYMLSGAPGMIEAIRKKLQSRGIRNDRIINDPFKGY